MSIIIPIWHRLRRTQYFGLVLLIAVLLAAPLGAANADAEKKPEPKRSAIALTWIDFAFINYVPLPDSRFADFSKINFGGSMALNFMFFNIKPLWITANIMVDENIPSGNRLDKIIDIGISLGIGWRITMAKRWYFTPRILYGYMLHYTYGHYYNDPHIYVVSQHWFVKKTRIFSDQYLQYNPEFAYDLSPISGKIPCEIFLGPEFVHFIERTRQGLEIGYRLGVRIKVYNDSVVKTESPVSILAGKVVDAESGLVLPNIIPLITGGPSKPVDRIAGETFANTVEAEKNYTLRAEYEGYEPASLDVNSAALKPNTRSAVTLKMKPSRIWGIYGHVFEKESNKPIKGVDVTVTDQTTNEVVPLATNRNGDFRLQLKPDSDYGILLKKRKYFTIRGAFSTRRLKPGWYDINKYMRTEFQKVEIGATMEFGNIYYDSGSWAIRPDVVPGLLKIVEFLQDNPTIVIELGAHTDSMGDAGENQVLSQKRAQSAVDFLIQKGIESSRITAKGYGETKLKNRCADGVACTPEDHQENRRTEIKVLKILR